MLELSHPSPSQPLRINFRNDLIIPELKGGAAFQVIDELIDHLISLRVIPAEARERIASAVREREASITTGIGFGVAIPHASTSLVKETLVVFGRSLGGIDFNSLDREPVRLVVLVIFPDCDKANHLTTLSRLSRLLHAKSTRTALENAADAAMLASVLNDSQ